MLVRDPSEYNTVVAYLGEGFLSGEFALATDIDGTLGHYRTGEHVDVEHNPELVEVFNILSAANGGAVAFVTGRPDEFVKNAFDGTNAFRVTENGALVRNADGEIISSHALPQIDDMRTDLIKALASDKMTAEFFADRRIFVEDFKDGTITIAFSDAVGDSPENLSHFKTQIGRVIQQVLDTNELWASGVDIIDSGAKVGNSYIEVLPSGLDKSTAVRELMKLEQFQGKRWLTLGDSEPDRPLLAASTATGGISIGVSDTAPDPMAQFNTPEQTQQLLIDIAEYVLTHNGGRFIAPTTPILERRLSL